jgi:H+/Cl- antiporter ClcA
LISLRTAWAKLCGTIAMLLAGDSVGRERPTVQISAALMVAVHRWLRVPVTAGVIIAGGAAGVAAAFNTPLAGVAFAIEELAAAFEQKVAVMVMLAVMISGLVSLGLAGDYVYFGCR